MSDTVTKIGYEGRIIRVIEKHLPDGRVQEIAIRPPGTRIIIHRLSDNHIMLTKEVRIDIGDDIRLPGGKVRDLIVQWDEIKNDPNLNQIIIDAGSKELREEAGLESSDLRIFTVSTSGGPTVDWTLYYLVSTNFTEIGHQALEVGENISTVWVPVDEVINLCLTGKMREGRSVAALLQYLHSVGLFQK